MDAPVYQTGKNPSFILINIGETFVSAEYLRRFMDGAFNVIAGTKTDLNRDAIGKKGRHSNYFYLKQILSQLEDEVLRTGDKHFHDSKIHCFYLPTLSTHRLDRISQKSEKSFYVNPKLLYELVRTFEAKSISAAGFDIIDRSVLRVFVNGYPLLDYLNKSATSLELDVFTGLLPNKGRLTTLRAIYANMSDKHIHEATFANSLLEFSKNNFSSKSGLAVCLLPESTCVLYLRDGIATYFDFLDYGEQKLIRETSSGMNSTFVVTLSNINLLMQGKLHGKTEEFLNAHLTSSVKNYVAAVNQSLTKNINKYVFGGAIYLLSTSKIGNMFVQAIAQSGLHFESYVSSEAPKVFDYSTTSRIYRNTLGNYDSTLGSIELPLLV